MMKSLWFTLPILWLSTAAAASMTNTVTVNAATQSACQFDTANSSPTIEMADYEAALASGYTGSAGQVSVIVFCNAGTPLTGRRIGGSAAATARGTAITVPLTLDGTPGDPTLNTLVWYTTGTSNTVNSGAFKGAVRYPSTIFAGYPQQAQFGAPTGFYTGTVDFTVEF
ncbi:hypothetical protein [Deinococcus sp. 23YEL01]|uniref:hypothetical protein n=1 Tax=Deinococcus sp. 23YEL01 TaxID=2745871 RepID=UPI001E46D141|nr:hypothetical protein [Deinococcus sp. 23YEL01]